MPTFTGGVFPTNAGGVPGGPAGGDLTGTYPNPTIAAGAVTLAKMAANSVDSSKIVDGSIVNADVSASAAIDASKIADGSVSNAEFQVVGTLGTMATQNADNVAITGGQIDFAAIEDVVDSGSNPDSTRIEIYSRLFASANLTNLASVTYVTYFYAKKSFAANSIRFSVKTAQVGGTVTLIRLAVYDQTDANFTTLGTQLATTTSDVTLYDSIGLKTLALSATVNFVKNTRYAVAHIGTVSVAYVTSPTIRGNQTDSNTCLLPKATASQKAAQTDVPAGGTAFATVTAISMWHDFIG